MYQKILQFGLAKCFLLSSVVATFELNAMDFAQCKQQIKQQAIQESYSRLITGEVIDSLQPLTRVIELDKRQPEFVESFAQYASLRVSKYRLNKGKEKLRTHKGLLEKLQQTYGIPPQILVSFWGLETNFGKNKGKMSVLNALATLACDPRRSEYFNRELFELFSLIDEKTVEVKQLQGSWAGAMGHMQFMPSSLRKYKVDGDKNGKVDVWQSDVDALTTAANYLQKINWQSDNTWGEEIILPSRFDFTAVEFDRYYPLSHFQKLGISTKKANDSQLNAELVLPAGAAGPAYVVYQNFNVIMKWNLSKNYALSVGLLADELIKAKGKPFNMAGVKGNYTKDQLTKLQQHLLSLNYSVGVADGVLGPKSRRAIRAFQLANSLVGDGFPNQEVLIFAGIIDRT